MILGALQSSYLPWLGFFEQMARCDVFVIYDDLQYTRKDWRNRNRIKTPQGPMWLTVPVVVKGLHRPRINDVPIDHSSSWARRHWKALSMNYSRARYFAEHAGFFERLYSQKWTYLADLNRAIIDYLQTRLHIQTCVLYSSEHGLEREFEEQYPPGANATDRIHYLCSRFGATWFYEGASGRQYIQEARLARSGIKIMYQEYVHPVYEQMFGGFTPYLSTVDLLFNMGPASLGILKS
jgi:hypothetical protein